MPGKSTLTAARARARAPTGLDLHLTGSVLIPVVSKWIANVSRMSGLKRYPDGCERLMKVRLISTWETVRELAYRFFTRDTDQTIFPQKRRANKLPLLPTSNLFNASSHFFNLSHIDPIILICVLAWEQPAGMFGNIICCLESGPIPKIGSYHCNRSPPNSSTPIDYLVKCLYVLSVSHRE